MTRTVGSHGPTTLEAIRSAGLDLIVAHGYEAMSLRQLAGLVGIQAGSLYNHIETKQALLASLVQQHLTDLIESLDATLAPVDGAQDRLRAFVTFHVMYHIERKKEVTIANSELRSLEPDNYRAAVALRKTYEGRLRDILDRGVVEGRFAIADTRVATYAIIAMLTGVCVWYRPGGRLSKAAIVAAHAKLVLDGVALGQAGRSRGKGSVPSTRGSSLAPLRGREASEGGREREATVPDEAVAACGSEAALSSPDPRSREGRPPAQRGEGAPRSLG